MRFFYDRHGRYVGRSQGFWFTVFWIPFGILLLAAAVVWALIWPLFVFHHVLGVVLEIVWLFWILHFSVGFDKARRRSRRQGSITKAGAGPRDWTPPTR